MAKRKLHEALAAARAAKNISLKTLGERTGLGPVTVFKIESGETVEPSFLKIVRIAKALGISLNKLAETKMELWCSPGRRKKLSARMKKVWKDPAAAKAMRAGAAKGARKMNKSLTPKIRERAVAHAVETRWG